MPFGIKFKVKGEELKGKKKLKKPVKKAVKEEEEVSEEEETEEEAPEEEAEEEPEEEEEELVPPIEEIETKRIKIGKKTGETIQVNVSSFDKLIDAGGLERGSTVLISGGCGTGKSTFAMQSVYTGIKKNKEKAVYILFEESVDKIKMHMQQNYGWDMDKEIREGNLAILRLNPFKIARSVEASLIKQRRALLVKVEQLELPFMPDKIVVDSLSALAVAFMGNTENYRYYIKHMFDSLEQYNSLNFIISETEQDPGIYSRTGIEEFLADGVIVLYNIRVGSTRKRVLEILKLRSSDHVKRLIPYELVNKKGIEIYAEKKIDKKPESMRL